ncbi:NADPH-dependent FMN reductase [Thermomonospora umbrina]|uniref:NAD(P)H-dependent FMN reductase n=1 Tax=Thermomonospora umbrina TaxID=111806 RepID=A0A3D9SKG2_9ACTN|nr:NAD(P)H-dependent oxidoreductase [Thermomonospora umbrina]REE96422.1 NAD(P)H-dependent FMN reductase [Thermomonospora umbrina]
MIRIAIVTGSTRPRRRTAVVARWVAEVAGRHPAVAAGEAAFEVVDLAEYGLSVLDEPVPALFGDYRNPHTHRWAETIASFDGFVFVTPEYNHSAPAALKNAIDFLFAEWNDKAAGFVSHGVHGGTRAVEHLRLIMTELRVANVRSQVALSVFTDFEITDPTEPGVLTPGPHQEPTLNELLDEVVTWSRVLKPLRTAAPVPAPTG